MGTLTFSVVISATSEEERVKTIIKVSGVVRPSQNVLSLLFGDFNFTEYLHDRFQKSSGGWSGLSNSKTRESFSSHLRSKLGFEEWAQDQMTCETGIVCSRIDRFYCNQHICEQLGKRMECSALPFPLELSAHRPLHFMKSSTTARKDEHLRVLSLSCIEHSLFPKFVKEEYERDLIRFPLCPAVDRLSLLKRSMRKACRRIQRLTDHHEALVTEENCQ